MENWARRIKENKKLEERLYHDAQSIKSKSLTYKTIIKSIPKTYCAYQATQEEENTKVHWEINDDEQGQISYRGFHLYYN